MRHRGRIGGDGVLGRHRYAPDGMLEIGTPILVPSMPGREAQRQIVLSDIHFRWRRFSDAVLSSFKDRDDLVSQVVAEYGQDAGTAGRDVDALLKGRIIQTCVTPPPAPAPALPLCPPS